MTDDARDAIMQATYEALCAEGYSDLTAQRIADRTEMSKGSLFYHYDSVDDLLASFIEYLLAGYGHRAEALDGFPPEERLAAYVEWWFDISTAEGTGHHTAMLELRAQAPYNELFQEKLRESDEALRDTLVDILTTGIETGAFVDHDPSTAADFLLGAFVGARVRHFTLGRATYSEHAYVATREYIETEILAPETTYPDEPAVTFPPDERFADTGDEQDAPDGAGQDDRTEAATADAASEHEDAE
ncbi:TetR family transcriptional regulator [Halovivax asiaticus JCM 14624]|uniref:TetR family transcriptional regulator n=1 Tax=Halovivax asiaticus JCM 14624 TaxID=1227490 RepID=M0BSC6_9EURY|nr:TetR/AcrR family transcriptional regulator [Halovivax asiaticus]ELZ12579.1 TetR family transcriptional regulator [Halovivax asiaticus JCM 14624]